MNSRFSFWLMFSISLSFSFNHLQSLHIKLYLRNEKMTCNLTSTKQFSNLPPPSSLPCRFKDFFDDGNFIPSFFDIS